MKFFDIRDYENRLEGISIFIGGRGIGKTYSAISYIYDKRPFLYMRNTSVQIEESCGSFGNPFKRWCKDHNKNIYMRMEKTHAVIYEENEEGETEVIGYGVSLSTFENLRGVDLSDVNYCLFDEFIENRKLTFDQHKSFVNFYETVNRNRDIMGEQKLTCLLLSNSQKLDNPILAGSDIIGTIENLLLNKQQLFRKQGLLICLPESEISDLKKDTDFYKLLKGSKIYEENIENKFAYDSFYGVVKRPIIEYRCIVAIDDIYIYRHKNSNLYYACRIKATNVREFNSRDQKSLFIRAYGMNIQKLMIKGSIEYSDFVVKNKLESLLM